MAKPGIGLGVLTPKPCLACLNSFPGIGMDGQRHTRVLRYWLWQQLAATIPLGMQRGWGTFQQGVLAQVRRGVCLSQQRDPMGQREAWHCSGLLCPLLPSYPGCLSTLSWGLQCSSLTIKAELGSPPVPSAADPGRDFTRGLREVKGEPNSEQISSKQKFSQLLQIRSFDFRNSDSTQ